MSKFNVDIDKVINDAEAATNNNGYIYPEAEFIRDMPEDFKVFDIEISSLSTDELLNKLSAFTSLYASVAVEEAKYLAQVAALQRELEIVKADVFTSSKAQKIRDKEKERDSNPEVVAIQEKLTVADVFLRRYSALRAAYDKYCFLYSRALTIQSEEKKLL